jgi:hypothetical protein
VPSAGLASDHKVPFQSSATDSGVGAGPQAPMAAQYWALVHETELSVVHQQERDDGWAEIDLRPLEEVGAHGAHNHTIHPPITRENDIRTRVPTTMRSHKHEVTPCLSLWGRNTQHGEEAWDQPSWSGPRAP